MKHSIRIRVIVIFAGIMAAVLLSMWAVNKFFLEDFYIREKCKILEDAYYVLNEMVLEKGEELDQELESLYSKDKEPSDLGKILWTLGEKYNTAIVIMDSLNDDVLPSPRNGRFLSDRVHQYILGRNNPHTRILLEKENYTIQQSFDFRTNSFYLESWGFFSDNRIIFIMSMPLDSIHDSVALSNRFIGYVGVAALVIGCILMYFGTKKVTSPILSLASLSERMSHLDFEARYEGNSQDEIGVLGNSMNTLSEKLKETIGELKEANVQLQKDIQEKIRIDEARRDFIANVSHELKTPIALIQGYAEGLTEGMAEDSESRDYYCEVIQDEAGKMNVMVKQLLNLTALESGNDKPVLERFDLTAMIQGALASARILLDQKNARVTFECKPARVRQADAPPDDESLAGALGIPELMPPAAADFHSKEPVYVYADEFKIEEVVTNYLNNALNHLEGGRLIVIRIQDRGNEVKVSVYNEGNPIPQEDLDKLWMKFYKVDKARTRSYGGSGIGLSIVKAIMDSHHKECGVENVKDGVEFWFTLDKADTNLIKED